MRRSVSFWHSGQEYMACQVAPSQLSKRLPISPLSKAIGGNAHDVRPLFSNRKTSPSENAPLAAAAVPNGVIPPDVPGSVVLPVVIRRGAVVLSTPSSVAHVSAVAVAS